MRLRSFLPLFVLALLLVSEPSVANPYEDGAAAYRRGDYAGALQNWKGLAEQGNQSAQYGLGDMYSLGKGVSRDDREAAKWYERAAASGHVPAQSRLGDMYDEGRGVRQSLSKAMKWYRRAAQQGDLHAQIALGLIYVTGRGVPQNYFQAEKWLRLASEKGDALAQYKLGTIYATGYDLAPKDNVQALVWFSLAAMGGNEDAGEARESFTAKMSPDQVEEAEKSIQSWISTKAQDKATRCSMSGPVECD